MVWLRKLTTTLTGYLVLYGDVSREIGRIAAVFFSTRWQRFRRLPASEQAFVFLTGAVVVFTFLPWRTYPIRFGGELPRRHGIYSDDFALILLGCIVALLPALGYIMPANSRVLAKIRFWRIGGVTLVLVLALVNWLLPQRIAPTQEATFAWSFYAFQALAFLWGIMGLLGVRTYAQ